MVHETARVLFDVELSKATPETRQGFVYFLRFHERVKIGFTTDIRGRFKAIPARRGARLGARHTTRRASLP